MDITFDYENMMYSIEQELAKIPQTIMSERKQVLQKAAKIIHKNVVENLPMSDLDETATNYDGTPYVHMKNDVKTSVKDDKQGTIFAIIRGGKYTGYKWHLVNNGTSSPDRPALHFIDKAMKQSENEIDMLIESMINKAVQ
ncbi:MAG: hypothetical protein K0R92_523 [Lachnospiraceae bacterium]|jgi:HK97 gp10 family phage protein|nr:hypothetical protein [Lachnospiraceae bacterium]